GMGARSLGCQLRLSQSDAHDLLRLHKTTYPTYWKWSKQTAQMAVKDGFLATGAGWTINAGPQPNKRSLSNFPLQATGADILRLASCLLVDAGVTVCAPLHDAFLIEAPADTIDSVVESCQLTMRDASQQALGGFPLRTEAKIIRCPERYKDS